MSDVSVYEYLIGSRVDKNLASADFDYLITNQASSTRMPIPSRLSIAATGLKAQISSADEAAISNSSSSLAWRTRRFKY